MALAPSGNAVTAVTPMQPLPGPAPSRACSPLRQGRTSIANANLHKSRWLNALMGYLARGARNPLPQATPPPNRDPFRAVGQGRHGRGGHISMALRRRVGLVVLPQ